METDGFYMQRVIIIQVMLPINLTPVENQTLNDGLFVDPEAIETLSNEMIEAIYTVANKPDVLDSSWFMRLDRVNYASDPNGQQTRVEQRWISFEEPPEW